MCHKNIFTYVYPDGHSAEQIKHDLCDSSRHGLPCKLTKTFQHPTEYVRSGQLSPPGYSFGQFPPTPPLSSHSASDSEHSSKGRSSVYINGEKVIDLNRRSSRRDKGERAGDHTVYVDSPPLSRTPPRKYDIPRSMPSSPREETIRVREPRHRETSPHERNRSTSTSSHSRPSIEVKIVNEPRHRRQGSSKSSSQSQDSDEEERRRKRRNSHVRFEDEEKKDEKKKDEKKKKVQSEIERANEDIANRPPVPTTTVPAKTRYRRGSVAVDPNDAALVLAMDQMSLERERKANLDRERRRREKRAAEQREREREEEEAQRQRLRDRMAPSRRATVSDARSLGRAREKIVYDDGRYRWE
ncbi:hypothetical protein F5Y00DRAFT_35758 [Daldinia vernicosa]|uniref:uncharacterized protein n=1 Tax=Daldinia vernicosa TaxID=114800 RepID=UPI0020079E7E|nr:uncharacterized protein F5Y00DRAFT_35758 [Daldinia vernicosa]KAI0850271.1 hypothetical protein F5Y00DRAFT_35758 [Daldinia vernicosa]